jgi:hypothetical protein
MEIGDEEASVGEVMLKKEIDIMRCILNATSYAPERVAGDTDDMSTICKIKLLFAKKIGEKGLASVARAKKITTSTLEILIVD